MSKKKLSSRYNKVNKLEQQRKSAIRKLNNVSKSYKDHVVINAVDNNYYLVETAHNVVTLETPDAIRDLE